MKRMESNFIKNILSYASTYYCLLLDRNSNKPSSSLRVVELRTKKDRMWFWQILWLHIKIRLMLDRSKKCIIRFWHKLKTWLNQMFWQTYQKLMLSGFLSSWNLCLINHLKLFWPHTASTASDRKGAKIQHEFFMIPSKMFFPNHQNWFLLVLKLLNSRTWMTLKTT